MHDDLSQEANKMGTAYCNRIYNQLIIIITIIIIIIKMWEQERKWEVNHSNF